MCNNFQLIVFQASKKFAVFYDFIQVSEAHSEPNRVPKIGKCEKLFNGFS